MVLSTLAVQGMVGAPLQVSAEELQFSGSTDISTEDYYLDMDTFSAELTVEEVYVQSGTQVQEGDKLLKITDESYQDALDYYSAAIIKANNTLTDTQREYDQGMLETQYAYEQALVKAEQAEFVRDYQQKELEDTITEHEDVLADIEEKIAELEDGIADGSYESASSSGGSGASGGGGSSSGGGSGSSGKSDSESDLKSETGDDTQSGQDKTEGFIDGTEDLPGAEGNTSTDGETEPEDGTGTEGETRPEGGTGTEGETQPEGGTESEGGTQPGGDTETGDFVSDAEARIEELKTQIEEKRQAYNTVLKEVGTMLGITFTEDGNADAANSAEAVFDDGASAGDTAGTLIQQLQESVTGDGNVKANLENVQNNIANIPPELLELAKSFYPNYEEYLTLLSSCISQLSSDIEIQQSVAAALEGLDVSGIDMAALGTKLIELNKISVEKSALQTELTAAQEEQITALETELKNAQEEIEELQASVENQPGTGDSTQEEPGEGSGTTPDTNTGNSPASGDNSAGNNAGAGSDPEGNLSSGNEEANGAGNSNMNGSGAEAMNGAGSSGMSGAGASGTSFSGGSSGTSAGGMSGEANSGSSMTGSGSGMSGISGEMTLSEDEISLFGDTYDLTKIISQVEQEPESTERAEELLEQILESQETVEEQYAELTRDKAITELGIQYTYDTAVIAGKLAEITYQQETQEWEATLTEAKDAKTELEEQKEFLSSMIDGILTADRSGTIASVSYEAEDVLSSTLAIVTYYDMDTVSIPLEVSQEDISKVNVGDTVEVSLASFRNLEGTISEKSLEAASGTSRTTVNYEVIVSVENSDGRISSGVSATVTIPEESDSDNEEEEASMEAAENE